MIYVDTSVVTYAVGADHPHREEAREFFRRSVREGVPLATSAQVLQELVDAYVTSDRTGTLDAAMTLVEGRIHTIWPVEAEDVRLARMLADRLPALGARHLLHLASCRRRNVARMETFDRALASAFE